MGQSDTAIQSDITLESLPSMFTTTAGGTTMSMPKSYSETLTWPELTYKDRTFVFSRELVIRVTQEEGGCSFAADELGLLGFGHTRSEAEQSFCLDFAIQWDDLVCEEDEKKLSKDAIELKRALLGLVKLQR
ncbi:MAG: hypothetical protein LBC63_02570 [Holophagales bacterium]|jgi:hypothetical protein|nr:hypothetical protein [Holophagales bacterium]